MQSALEVKSQERQTTVIPGFSSCQLHTAIQSREGSLHGWI